MRQLTLTQRLFGFSALPAISAISPLLVLPLVARSAGPEGWASALSGEVMGTLAGVIISYGWSTIGPPKVANATDPSVIGRLYRESLFVRFCLAMVVLPVLIIICGIIAGEGYRTLTILMGLQGATIALSFVWFSVGIADPRSIALFDAIPRVLAAGTAAALILATGIVELYPVAGLVVTLAGTTMLTKRVLLQYPSTNPRFRDIFKLLRANTDVAVSDTVFTSYLAFPLPLVHLNTPSLEASSFASADKMVKLGMYVPFALGNALQAWTAEAHGKARVNRVRASIGAHALLGLLGWTVISTIGPMASEFLFGSEAIASRDTLVILGFAFALYSIRSSLTRHLLLPSGDSASVMTATLIGSLLGIGVMVGLTPKIGANGAAIGYALTEAMITIILTLRAPRGLQKLQEV